MSPDIVAPNDAITLATAQQGLGADPAASAWVAASAGSGKTRVLTDRLLRLLLSGARPEGLLCLTYTKAAAAEMANRLNKDLAAWATAPRAALAAKLHALTGTAPDDASINAARKMLAATLDAPGGMRIGTIHSFAQTLLRRFPLEAQVAPNFALLDELDKQGVLRDAREGVLAGVQAEDARADALDRLARRFAPQTFNGLIKQIIETGQAPPSASEMLRAFGLPADATAESLIADAVGGADEAALRAAVAALAAGSDTEARRAAAMQAWLDAGPGGRGAAWRDWRGLFITKEGTIGKTLVNKPTEARAPGALAAMQAEGERILAEDAKILALQAAQVTGAMSTLATPVLENFRAAKRARATLDYDDLIHGAETLLSGDDAPWVLFRLDGGLDHLLIDEAQDTSPAQWAIAKALTADFFAGSGARDGAARTVFAVGDAKQSIFSFQGADPAHFAASGAHFSVAVRDTGQDFHGVELPVSFRSTTPVLRLVDAVEPAWGPHFSAREGHAGSAELWPLFTPLPPPDDPDADPPPGPDQRCAEAIAATIARWLRNGEVLPARGRTLRAGDVLVLVRRRRNFLHHLVRALKNAGVPVAGADRIRLTDSLAVLDCMAFLDALLLPEDDLNLATVLKGPFCALDEASLMVLALDRPGRLIDALRSRAAERADWNAAHDLLEKFRARADFADAHALLCDLLDNPVPDAPTGREALLARLGPEAADPLDEFLRAALADALRHPASLQGFLHRLRTANVDIKRDANAPHDAVRVMTVHGAKGLQAPVVFLADTVSLPEKPSDIVRDPRGRPVWLPKAAARPPLLQTMAAAKERADLEEYARLLYVALTRAEDRLIVVGWEGARAADPGCWHSRVAAAMAGLSPDAIELPGAGQVQRIACAQTVPPKPDSPRAAANAADALPHWVGHAPEETPAVARVKPSGDDAAPDEFSAPPPFAADDAQAARLRRGDLTHLLLQVLPTLAPAEREAAAARIVASAAPDQAQAIAAAIVAEALAVLADPEAAAIFHPAGLAEAPIVGQLGGRPVNGVIDRLVVRPQDVWLADFKTDRAPAASPEVAPPKYIRQLAIYRALLRGMFPDRKVRCALVWTATPSVMVLPDALLDQALA
jgi:ATP-dependent helicase/nuclease subunit A